MLSGRGIDGELKSKFGEWSEKFWKSGVMKGNLRAIYFASEEGEDGSGGKTLSELKGGDGRQMISTESGEGDKVKKFFGICTNGQNGDDCKENNDNASVVMVGDDPNINSSMTWEKLKSEKWGQTSLVRSGQSYEGLFDKRFWKGGTPVTGSKFNPLKITQMLNLGGSRVKALQTLCPLVPSSKRQVRQTGFSLLCANYWNNNAENEEVSLSRFLTGANAKRYFESNVWEQYYNGDRILALVVLLDLWSNDLTSVDFSSAKRILNARKEGFMLAALMSGNGAVISLIDGASDGRVCSVSYRRGGTWTIQLCSERGDCSSQEERLNVIVGNDQLCVSTVVCVKGSDIRTRYPTLKSYWAGIKGNRQAGALWDTIFGTSRGVNHLERLLIALLVACFGDVKNVSLSVQEPLKGGEVVFTQLNNEK